MDNMKLLSAYCPILVQIYFPLSQQIDIDSKEDRGRTALHCAVWGKEGGREGRKSSKNGEDSPECAALLLEHGANVYATDKRGFTPIHIAAVTNAPHSLELLLRKGCDVNIKNKYGWAPLHASLRFGAVESFQVLLTEGAELEGKDGRGFEAFDLILVYDEVNVLKHLLEKVQYPNVLRYARKHFTTMKSLKICIDNNSALCMCILLEAYKEDFANTVKGWDELVKRCVVFNSFQCLQVLTQKVLPAELELAVYFSDKDVFEYLLEKYYKEQVGDYRIEERILKACIVNDKKEYALMMLKYSKTCQCESKEGVINSDTFSWSLQEIGEIYNMKMLKKRRPMLTVPDFTNLASIYTSNNILHLAIEYGVNEVTQEILETDVNLNTRRRTDQATPLILATKVTPLVTGNRKMSIQQQS
eukprot:TRINITY_DN2678_c0_g1_i1.p1 TRINITY_DN2678_c0_g1~~TRINITY_DN2678_c0_g1_i1.p1  ORF type:complete len:416 (+),score=44.49 TRINITY_DN2678_c0_g1_i1:472-1719(+)